MTTYASAVTLHNIRNEEIAVAALKAAHSFMAHPDYPQHKKLGKSNGGLAVVDGMAFFVWKTTHIWHSQYEPRYVGGI